MLYPRQTELLSRLKAVGLRARDVAAVWGTRPNVVSQRLGGFLPLSKGDELALLRLIESAEKAKMLIERKGL